MATLGISEFTFGYAFLQEQVLANWPQLVAAPILPSLRQEKAEGWDAKLPVRGGDYYYQFKLSEYLSRRNSRFIRDGTYSSDYFRISLHRSSVNLQHRRLWAFARQNPRTYYVAPEMTTALQFDYAFLSRRVTDSSRLIPLSACPSVPSSDGSQHYITFQGSSTRFIFHSEAISCGGSVLGSALHSVYADSSAWQPIDAGFALCLLERTIDILQSPPCSKELAHDDRRYLGNFFRGLPNDHDMRLILREVARLLLVYFGVVLVLVGEPRGNGV